MIIDPVIRNAPVAAGRLAGKQVLVTGAGSGIGRAIAIALSSEAATVHAMDRDEPALDRLIEEERSILARPGDVTDRDAIAGLETTRIDILVNCAGAVRSGTILECPEQDLYDLFDINLVSAYRLIRAVLPGMAERRNGAIINIASIVSSLRAAPGRFAYATSKAALIGLTKSVALDYVGQGIRCNAICPGTVDSPSLRARVAAADDPEAAYAQFVARQPMGRLGRPEEIAALAVHLASDESAYTTGSVYTVDGGWSA